jgi:aminocarboxymuconate-semialdehyde decarboxylase
LATSVSRSYNNATSRILKRYPGRFLGMAHIPMQSPSRAIDELNRAILDLGMHAALMFTNVDGRNLDEPEFWPVYRRIEELNVPLILHPSRSGKLLGLDRLMKFHLDNALGFLYEGTLAITSLITGGVLDLFPKLRVGIMETGVGYLPTLMDRLNEVYDQEGVDRLIKKRPHEYLNQIYLAANVTTEKETLLYVIQRFGVGQIMMAIDFPHGLGGAGESAVDDVFDNPGLTDAQRDRILGLNAAELFAVPLRPDGSAVAQPAGAAAAT